jgi:hypothetical protein
MMYPGDPSADPGDLCNCGCNEVTVDMDEDDE